MNCTEFLKRLDELALNGPEFKLPSVLREHQRNCDECRDHFFELQEAWLMLPAALGREPISAEFEAKVMDRLKSAPMVSTPTENSATTFRKYALAATVLIVLVGGTMLSPHWTGLGDAAVDQDIGRIQEFARQMDRLKELEGAFAAPELRFVSLKSVGSRTPAEGYLVYDFLAKEGHFFGFDLTPSEGQTYVLWLLDSDRRVAGSAAIDVDSDNLGAAIVQLPENPSVVHEVLVNLEPDVSPVSPSSDVRMRWIVGQ